MAVGSPMDENVDKSPVAAYPSSSSKLRTGNLSTAMTSAFDMSPAVKMVPPRLPWPVLASGKSPLADRRMAKNRCGTSISKRDGLASSTKRFIGTSVATSSAADAGDSHGIEDDDATVMAAVDWRRRRRWADIIELPSLLTDGSANPNGAAT